MSARRLHLSELVISMARSQHRHPPKSPEDLRFWPAKCFLTLRTRLRTLQGLLQGVLVGLSDGRRIKNAREPLPAVIHPSPHQPPPAREDWHPPPSHLQNSTPNGSNLSLLAAMRSSFSSENNRETSTCCFRLRTLLNEPGRLYEDCTKAAPHLFESHAVH
jgi:hypothetical protein